MANHSSAQEKIDAVNCIIRADNKLVLTHEVMTNTLSVPGGHLEGQEKNISAVERQTWEETGIVVSAGKMLGTIKNIAFYDCIPEADIVAFYTTNHFGGYEFPTWFAPEYGTYTASAMLVNPYELNVHEYRFPAEWNEIKEMFNQATESHLSFTKNMINSTSKTRQAELKWLSSFQNWSNSLSVSSRDLVVLTAIGLMSLAGPTAKLFLFPFLIWRFGQSFAHRVFFAISISSVIVLFAQQTFVLPRPHVYIPVAELFHSSGYSMPSLTTTIWFCILVLLFKKAGNFGNNRYTWLAALVTFLVMASKFFLATLFISDIVVSALLGSLIAWHIYRLDENTNLNVDTLLISQKVWFLLAGTTLIFTMIWPIPAFKVWLGIFLSAALLRIFFRGKHLQLNFRKMIFSIILLVGTSYFLFYLKSLLTFSRFWSEFLFIIHYPILMCVLMLLASKKDKNI
ncbi:phospholipid phosphatase [Vibrio sagamiensis NBRC 104589]|uniref:undecaprenyl-diphosphate phosphatase n=1 Tax=Vibrio sagamiensis NBRC 104589 TaxID=1219064 RepID=A0A511QE63_9VIBR|nr:phospholipid phosphatase [Vibrio sagamiensis NBRC 104589]